MIELTKFTTIIDIYKVPNSIDVFDEAARNRAALNHLLIVVDDFEKAVPTDIARERLILVERQPY